MCIRDRLIVVYMCDRATKYGIGGKVSVFMVNIVSGMMTMFTGKPLEKLAPVSYTHLNNEIDRAYYFTILRTPWGEQMEDGLLSNSMGRIVDRTGMLEKLLKKVTQNNIRLVFRCV